MAEQPRSGIPEQNEYYSVEFWEYSGILSVCKDEPKVPDVYFDSITYNIELPIDGTIEERPQRAKDKWIYIFKKTSNQKVSLSYELLPEVSDHNQTFKCVSWLTEEDKKKCLTTYPREPKQKKLNMVCLSSNFEYYVFLSGIQLPITRINKLLRNVNGALGPRSVHIPKNPTQDKLDVYLLDYDSIAKLFNETAQEDLCKLEAYLQDEEKIKRGYLADAVYAIAQSKPKMKKWLDDFATCEKERNEHISKLETLRRNKGNSVSRLTSFLRSPGYREMLNDHNGNKKIETEVFEKYSDVLKIMDTDQAGRDYLAEAVADKESWLSRYFLAPEPFLTYRKLSTLAKEESFSEFLKHYIVGLTASLVKPSMTITVEQKFLIQLEIIEKYEAIVQRAEVHYFKGKFFTVYRDPVIELVEIRYSVDAIESRPVKTTDFSMREKHRQKWQGKIDSLSLPAKNILLAFEIVNSIFAVKAMAQAKPGEKLDVLVNLFGSALDTFCATDYLYKTSWAKKMIPPSIIAKLNIRIIPGASIISGLCDGYGALRGMSQAMDDKNPGLIFGNVVVASASVMMVAGGVGTLFSVAGAAMLGFVGIAVFFIGAAIVWAFTEEDLEKWAKSSPWVKNPRFYKTLDEQIIDLNKILCQFNTECYFNRMPKIRKPGMTAGGPDWDYTFTVRICHGMMRENISRFKIDLTIELFEGNFLIHPEKIIKMSLVLPDKNTSHIHKKDAAPFYVCRFPYADQVNLSQHVGRLKYSMSAQMDFNGDGKTMFPDQPMIVKPIGARVLENDEELPIPVPEMVN